MLKKYKGYIHVITALDHGGTEKFLSRLLKEEGGYHVLIVLSSEKLSQLNLFKLPNIDVHVFDIKNLNSFYNLICMIYSLGSRSEDFICCYTWLYHADLVGGILFKILTPIPVRWSIRSTEISRKLLGLSTFLVVKINAVLSSIIPSRIIYCSQPSKVKHLAFGYSPAIDSVIIGNGISADEFTGLTTKCKMGKVQVGCFARWDPNKGIDILLKKIVQNNFNNIDFHFFGDEVDFFNDAITSIFSNNDSAPKNIFLHGHSKQPQLDMLSCDYIVIPSVSEGFPNVALESLSLGIPVISRNVGAAQEIIGNNGYIFNSNEEMVDILQKINGGVYSDVENKSHALIRQEVLKRYSITTVAKKYFER